MDEGVLDLNHITEELKENLEREFEILRAIYQIPENIRFFIVDTNYPLKRLIKIIKNYYKNKG